MRFQPKVTSWGSFCAQLCPWRHPHHNFRCRHEALPLGSKGRWYETKQMPGTRHWADFGLDQDRPRVRRAFDEKSFKIRRRFGKLVGNVEGSREPIVFRITQLNTKLLPELILLHLAHVSKVTIVE